MLTILKYNSYIFDKLKTFKEKCEKKKIIWYVLILFSRVLI